MKNEDKTAPEQSKKNNLQKNFSLSNVTLTVLLLVIGYVSLAQAYSNPFTSQITTQQPVGIQSPKPEITPTHNPTVKPFPTIRPTVKPTTFPSKPIPTIPPTPNTGAPKKEKVNCVYDDKCGGKKETTSLECNTTLCCPIGGEYKIASINDCYVEQNKLLKASYAKSLSENNKNVQAYQESEEEDFIKTLEQNTAAYNECVAEVQAWHGQQQSIWGARGTSDSYGTGSFQERVEKPYKSYLSRCDTSYQPRN